MEARKYSDKEVAEIICKAWNILDASLIKPLLLEEFEYVSVWVLDTMKGKEKYLDYLSRKFETIKTSGSKVKADVWFQEAIGKHVVLLNQDGIRSCALEITLTDDGVKQIWMRPPSLTLPAVFSSKKPEGINVAERLDEPIDISNMPIVREVEEMNDDDEDSWLWTEMIASQQDMANTVRCIEHFFSTKYPSVKLSWIHKEEKGEYCDLMFSAGKTIFDVLIELHYGNERFLDVGQTNNLIENSKRNNHVPCIAALASEAKVYLMDPVTTDLVDFDKCVD